MRENHRRNCFQIHLSTAIVFVLLTGGILGANLVPKKCVKNVSVYGNFWSGTVLEEVQTRGWPLPWYEYFVEKSLVEAQTSIINMTVDGLIALVGPIGVSYTYEVLLRNRGFHYRLMNSRKGRDEEYPL